MAEIDPAEAFFAEDITTVLGNDNNQRLEQAGITGLMVPNLGFLALELKRQGGL